MMFNTINLNKNLKTDNNRINLITKHRKSIENYNSILMRICNEANIVT